ncbi:MAG: hypothetical protein KUA43_08800 [Hoeflea sp.]|uniref:hypothetical protein n=1 Tax=Hoeflea sp. TaxID=1940281 RepID=UPI001E19FD19|nr:hypothetical protein [Hoeflea sp.]MBU4529763.1 hypothetical protein [Alphaproteobacteria bacterium]MBU4543324.1 hypothetical protein [Alphaproteobacteria bacterium]MBU4552511.1 hypothetical protein [Alphaproteobacteria bacterium]MBV1723527.1 hypothetical protein [Hoeflea sp.]MBV1762976.1 hypothetical protein [Hoeflea sp.]
MDLPASKLFSQRMAHWTGNGLSGAALYQRLAEDDELPISFDPTETAAIIGVNPLSLKKQRNRGTGPEFMRASERAVRYPRPSLCMYLASRYVTRDAGSITGRAA